MKMARNTVMLFVPVLAILTVVGCGGGGKKAQAPKEDMFFPDAPRAERAVPVMATTVKPHTGTFTEDRMWEMFQTIPDDVIPDYVPHERVNKLLPEGEEARTYLHGNALVLSGYNDEGCHEELYVGFFPYPGSEDVLMLVDGEAGCDAYGTTMFTAYRYSPSQPKAVKMEVPYERPVYADFYDSYRTFGYPYEAVSRWIETAERLYEITERGFLVRPRDNDDYENDAMSYFIDLSVHYVWDGKVFLKDDNYPTPYISEGRILGYVVGNDEVPTKEDIASQDGLSIRNYEDGTDKYVTIMKGDSPLLQCLVGPDGIISRVTTWDPRDSDALGYYPGIALSAITGGRYFDAFKGVYLHYDGTVLCKSNWGSYFEISPTDLEGKLPEVPSGRKWVLVSDPSFKPGAKVLSISVFPEDAYDED